MLCYGYLGVGLGGVGWGNNIHVNLHTHVMLRYGDLFMSTCTHTSCYVMVIFSCTCTHTSCYVMVILGWGWVGWGGAITSMSTCTHTSCYVMVIFSCTGTHTSCYVMVVLGWGWVGWGNNVHVNLHTHVMLRYGDLLMDQTNAKNPLFFPVHCGDANRWQMVERPEKLYSQKLSKTVVSWSQHKRAPWIGKVCLGLLLAKIFGTTDTSPISRRTLQGRQSNEELLRRREKSAASQKNTNLCQKTK